MIKRFILENIGTGEYDSTNPILAENLIEFTDSSLREDIDSLQTEIANIAIPTRTSNLINDGIGDGWPYLTFPDLPSSGGAQDLNSVISYGNSTNQFPFFNSGMQISLYEGAPTTGTTSGLVLASITNSSFTGQTSVVVSTNALPDTIVMDNDDYSYVIGMSSGNIQRIANNGISSNQYAVLPEYTNKLVIDSTGNLFNIDPSGVIRIVRRNPDALGQGIVSVFATLPETGDMVIDRLDNLLITQSSSNTIVKVDSEGVVSTYITNLSQPKALAVNVDGTVFVNNAGSNNVISISPQDTRITLYNFAQTSGDRILVDPKGWVYFIDTRVFSGLNYHDVVRCNFEGYASGAGTIQTQGTPDIAINNKFDVYFADREAGTIYKFISGTTSNTTITYSNNNGEIGSMYVTDDDVLYFTDMNNYQLRKVTPPIRKVLEIGNSGEVLKGFEMLNKDVVNQLIERHDSYSYQEIKTKSVWVDDRPIYRRVVHGVTNPYSGSPTIQQLIALEDTTIKTVISCTLIAKVGDTITTTYRTVDIIENTVIIRSDGTNLDAFESEYELILEYVKIT